MSSKMHRIKVCSTLQKFIQQTLCSFMVKFLAMLRDFILTKKIIQQIINFILYQIIVKLSL